MLEDHLNEISANVICTTCLYKVDILKVQPTVKFPSLSLAIEHGSGGFLGKMSQPIGMNRRTFSYDDALEDTAPMTPPPPNMSTNILWKRPVVPERKYEDISKNLKMQSGEMAKEDKQASSAQSTPSSTPHSSPKRTYRGWFSQGSSASITGPELAAMDSGGGDGDKVPSEKWSFFGPRALQKHTDSGGFTVQAYKGAQKPTPMELMRAHATRMAEDPATFKPPKMDIPAMDEKKRPPSSHNLRPRDMNVLTPTGF
ncbi:putative monooxygenase p33MONOX isoform X3 [Zootoca vivipara]|uniref:putative monooxygenase p33MONOX isoform X3 n=1 Tax=Zootoca vivipara TaxID=8524 RepID=UPI0015911DEA|nr:putative monooxygenase p33MONOX isoform X3 [Zootoca vivipara]